MLNYMPANRCSRSSIQLVMRVTSTVFRGTINTIFLGIVSSYFTNVSLAVNDSSTYLEEELVFATSSDFLEVNGSVTIRANLGGDSCTY
jgi:hypothetical protein